MILYIAIFYPLVKYGILFLISSYRYCPLDLLFMTENNVPQLEALFIWLALPTWTNERLHQYNKGLVYEI